MIETYPILTLLPPVLAIALAIATRKVLFSLGLGVVSAAVLITDFEPISSLRRLWTAFSTIFWSEGELNTGYVYILIFTLLLGIIAAFILMSGGTRAFADWAMRRITTRRGAQVLPAALGIVIFIDDYFNALAVGQVSRPVTDRHRVSRAKLAYIVDSTSAPVAVLAPFSSWGAYIMGLMAPLVAASTLTMSSVQAFLGAAATNYYAIAAALTVWLVVGTRLDFGPMRNEERRAIVERETFDAEDDIPGQLSADLPMHHPGAMRALIVPFLVLVVAVFAGIAWTGQRAAASWSIVDILAETDVPSALLYGGLAGLAVALFYYFRYTASNPKFAAVTFGRGWVEGIRSMMPAISILLLAWMLGGLVDELGTGEYLGRLVEGSNLPVTWLVPVTFLVAGAMAFSTGTSWGSFGLLLPIAAGIMNSLNEPDLLIPVMGASWPERWPATT